MFTRKLSPLKRTVMRPFPNTTAKTEFLLPVSGSRYLAYPVVNIMKVTLGLISIGDRRSHPAREIQPFRELRTGDIVIIRR